MIYKPSVGRMKDGCMIYVNGVYYLYSMYLKEGSDEFRNVWLATSEDGVHFKDYGCVVEDFSEFVWAMKVYEGDDGFYLNSGSFTEDGKQAVLKFWRSDDLLHWEYRPELDVISPDLEDNRIRLDCMCVVKKDDKYYGYATGQYGYLTSDDGAHWNAHPMNIDYTPFPPYNPALGGFEIADFIEIDGKFYLLCGGFGHLGMSGYGVFVYESTSADGPFKPCLPNYRLNGTAKRWVNMWERFFKKDGQYLAHNYMYDGYTYENGAVYLPPVKRLQKTERGLRLLWWEGNEALRGDMCSTCDSLTAQNGRRIVFEDTAGSCDISTAVPIPANGAVAEMTITLQENTFTEYSAGGVFLSEDGLTGSAVLFDTYGKCEIAYVKDGQIADIEDTIGFGSTSLYYLESGHTYTLRILTKGGLFEVYVDDVYLQTFNSAHLPGTTALPFSSLAAISCRGDCTLGDIRVYHIDL